MPTAMGTSVFMKMRLVMMMEFLGDSSMRDCAAQAVSALSENDQLELDGTGSVKSICSCNFVRSKAGVAGVFTGLGERSLQTTTNPYHK